MRKIALLFVLVSMISVSVFAALDYTQSPQAAAQGSVVVSDDGSGNYTLTATPNSGYVFYQWSDAVKTATRVVNNAQAGQSFTAQFAEAWMVTLYVDGTSDEQIPVIKGCSIATKPERTAPEGYVLKDWTTIKDDASTAVDFPYEPSADVTLYPLVELKSDELTLSEEGMPSYLNDLRTAETVIETVHIGRTLQGGMYNTLCLPFDVPSFTGTPLEGCDVQTFSDALLEDKTLNIYCEAATSIEAGKPYLVKPAATITGPMDFANAQIKVIEGTTIEGKNADFIAKLNPYLVPNDGRSVCVMANNQLAYVDGKWNMPGMRAFFYVGATVDGSPVRLCIGGVTGLSTVKVDAVQARKLMMDGRLVIQVNDSYYSVEGGKIQ